jgi:hypothetical protein
MRTQAIAPSVGGCIVGPLRCGRENSLHNLKAGPAGGLRPGNDTTGTGEPASPSKRRGTKPHRQSRNAQAALRRARDLPEATRTSLPWHCQCPADRGSC